MGEKRVETGRAAAPVAVRLREWAADDLWVLRRANEPEMTAHLGGPEGEEQVLQRHERYLRLGGDGGRMYVIEADPGPDIHGEVMGSIGFWGRVWQDEAVYETGWGVLPEFQGRGVAAAAARAVVGRAAALGNRRHLHAYPSVDHPASNGVCRRAGFTLLGEVAFEYPKGHPITCNDWRVDLTAPGAPGPIPS
ncbi:GNAT family N-acetyltransferase [Streptomyces sp. CA2R106]|uniref:GNAT family N-acetyltransferase n=1 Tax=Streptomyces sp. CA2R106 TaxID=3120153 RepID=UPI003009F5F9